MGDPRVKKLANLFVNYSVVVQPGDKVGGALIRCHFATLPLCSFETF